MSVSYLLEKNSCVFNSYLALTIILFEVRFVKDSEGVSKVSLLPYILF